MVQGVLNRLRTYGVAAVSEMAGDRETTHFRLPESL